MAKTFSLCLTTQNINVNNKTILFRLADKLGDELQEPNYCEHELSDAYEESGYPYPYTAPKNHIISELKIWEWDPLVREWAKKTSIPFYELINTFDIALLAEEAIVRLLKKGHAIPNYLGQKALLVIGEDEDIYRVIEIDSGIVKNTNGIVKLNGTVTKINGYILSKRDFLSTKKVRILSSDGEQLPQRIIYKYLSMQEPDFILDTLSFNEKMEMFINKQIKTRNFSKAQQKEIKNLFVEILSDYDKINEFFDENGFNRDGLLGKINNVCYSINDVLSDNNLWDKFSKVIIENLPELTDKFTQLVEKRFLENNKNRLEVADLEILGKEKTKSDLTKHCKEYETNLALLERKKITLEQNVKEIENTYNSLKLALMNRVTEIKQDMAGFISEMALFELLGFTANQDVVNKKNYNIVLANIIEDEVDVLYDINEFIDTLALNLQIAGIEAESRLIVSKFITGSIKQKNGLLLVGKFTRNIADAISATLCGMGADIISVTSPNADLSEITEQINICNSKVVLIENIVNLNEIVTLQLLRLDFNKLIIFANDISETVNFIPNSLLSRINLLCLDFICERILYEEFDYTDASKVKFENKYNTSTYKAAKEELEKLTGKCIYSNSHCAVKSELISIIDDIGQKEGLYSWLFCEAIPHQILSNEKDVLEEIIDILQLSEKHTNKLKKMIG
jgi:hypothetical protein